MKALIYDGEVLTLKDSVKSDNEKLDALTEEMKLPMMLTSGFENGSDTTKQMEGQLKRADEPGAGNREDVCV